jgi:hypothetical protein
MCVLDGSDFRTLGTPARFHKAGIHALYNSVFSNTTGFTMNAPLAASLFGAVDLAPRDPILGVTEAFNADANPRKVNLGVGVYVDDNGKVPLLDCVKRAEREMTDKASPRTYLPIDGIPAYDKAVQLLLLGTDSEIVALGRAVTVQALGGTGGLRVGADFLRKFAPGAKVAISTPSWENHRALFEAAGFEVISYPYYDAATHGLDFAAMRASLNAMASGTIVVLHACCHNPTGVDPTPSSGTRSLRPSAHAGSCHSSISRIRASGRHRRRRHRRAQVRCNARTAVHLELVLEIVLALWRARRCVHDRRQRQGRGCARAVAGEAHRARQLLESTHARRANRRDGAHQCAAA